MLLGVLIYPLLHLLMAYWVYQDAQKRNMSILWAVGALFVPVVFIILYLIFRTTEPNFRESYIVRVCFCCGKKIREGERYCPNCGADTQNTR
jgi:hypothetical protein